MKLTTLKHESKLTIQEIEQRLRSITSDSLNQTTIDDAPIRSFTLRVKFNTRGSDWFMTIHTQLFLESHRSFTRIKCVGNITKPVIISLLVGVMVALSSLIHQNWLAAGFIGVISWCFTLLLMLRHIKKKTKAYLKALGV